MNLWHDLPLEISDGHTVTVVVEIPLGGRVKYELDKTTGLLRATRVLYGALHYPANYGFLPRTLDGDGDPLDVLVLSQESVLPGSLVSARMIGVMPMNDQGDEDDKIIAVMVGDPAYKDVYTLAHLPEYRVNEIMRFFSDYKVLERKEVRVERPLGVDDAKQVLQNAIELYNKTHGDPAKRG